MSADIKTILITGGSGMIGSLLADRLQDQGHQVRLLSRDPSKVNSRDAFYWNIDKGEIDVDSLLNLDAIVSLAGASIAGARWSAARKRVLRKSRVDGNLLILKTLRERGLSVSQFIGASAVGYYGDRGDKLLDEESMAGQGFMSNLCADWEYSQEAFKTVADQVAIVRIGLVLANQGGVLPTLQRSIVLGIGTSLGSGNQYMSWIHIDDLIRIFELLVARDKINGVFNGVSPSPIQHRTFMKNLVKEQGGLGLIIPIPAFLIRLVMGEMSHVVLDSARVAPDRLQQSNFAFEHVNLQTALSSLIT